MTKEEKQLLLKDLCGRLPYGVVIQLVYYDKVAITRKMGSGTVHDILYNFVDDAKPYLRPMSSMTEGELDACVMQTGILKVACPNSDELQTREEKYQARLNHFIKMCECDVKQIDWLNAHHFDYRGLIEKGLALEAPEGMYNKK